MKNTSSYEYTFCKQNLADFFFMCTNVRFTFVIYLGMSHSSIPHFASTDICGLIPLSCMNENDHAKTVRKNDFCE